MKSRLVRTMTISGLLLCLASALASGQTTLSISIPGLPGTLNWQNAPRT